MKSKIGHIYLYVSDLKRSYDFYSKFLTFLDYKESFNKEWGFSFINDGTSIWFVQAKDEYIKDGYHRKRVGLNHLAFRVNSKEDVDKFYKNFFRKTKFRLFIIPRKPILNTKKVITQFSSKTPKELSWRLHTILNSLILNTH